MCCGMGKGEETVCKATGAKNLVRREQGCVYRWREGCQGGKLREFEKGEKRVCERERVRG